MSIGRSITRYLPYEDQVRLLSDLVDNDQLDEVLEILTSVSIPSDVGIENAIFQKIRAKLSNEMATVKEKTAYGYVYNDIICDVGLRTFAQLICTIDAVWEQFENWLSNLLIAYIKINKKKLLDEKYYEKIFTQLIKFAEYDAEPTNDLDIDIILILKFLELVYAFADKSKRLNVRKLDDVVISLLGCDSEIIALASSSLIKWRISDISERCHTDIFFDSISWLSVRYLLSDGVNYSWKQRNGLLFILRFLSVCNPSQKLTEFIQMNEYWKQIQYSLANDAREYRKLGLAILRLTIKKISATDLGPFTTSTVSWDARLKTEIKQSWKNFTTLYEIVALDAALNQIQAASSDILDLFNDSSLHPTWGLLLFSTGSHASTESVRKYMMSLLFQIRDRSIFKSDLVALKETFLPCSMEAHYFNTDGISCPYGDRFTQFIASIISNSGEDATWIVKTLLELLVEHSTSFDPARIYLSLGILKSLKKQNSRLLTSVHLKLIRKLFEFESEDAVFQTTAQTIYLKFLLHVNQSVSSIEWLQSIVTHIKCMGDSYEYFSSSAEDFKDFAITYFNMDKARQEICSFIGTNSSFDLLSIVLFECEIVSPGPQLLLEISRSGEDLFEYSSKAVDLLANLLTGNSANNYDSAAALVAYPGLHADTWKSIELEKLYESVLREVSVEKLKFLVAVYKRVFDSSNEVSELKWSEVLALYDIIKQHVEESAQKCFKYRDEIYGSYFEFLSLFLRSYALKSATSRNENNELMQLMHLLQKNIREDNGNYLGNLGASNLCGYILDTYIAVGQDERNEKLEVIFTLFEMLSFVWDSISSERLVLKQKDLHISLIKNMFHPTILYFTSYPKGRILTNKLEKYGAKIVKQAYSRRSILPEIGFSVNLFMHLHNKHLQDRNSDYGWLIRIMVLTFVGARTTVNIFKIKPVIAALFDKNLSSYQMTKGLYEQVYGAEEISARVSIINALLESHQLFKEQFISETVEFTNLLVPKKRTDGAEEIQRLLKWQLILVCLPSVSKTRLQDLVDSFIFKSLKNESSPCIRIYMEWTIAYALAENYENGKPSVLEEELLSLFADHTKPFLTVSVERICFVALKALAAKGSKDYTNLLNKFTGLLIPNATSNKPLIRHFSNSLIISFYPAFQSSVKDEILKTILERLFRNADDIKVLGHFRAGDANTWDVYGDLTLTGIFGGALKKVMDHDVPYISEELFVKYLSSKDIVPIGHNENLLWLNKRTSTYIGPKESLLQKSAQLQTKNGAWEMMMDIDDNSSSGSVKRSDLIVVSSLVDKPPNLGGICRLCDVLGVGTLTVQDLRVKNHPQFKNVAVTADKWMPIIEVSIDKIIEFMRAQKKEGYTLIGLEQTDKSIKLDTDYKFPRKSLVLLGSEAHGIPGNLLAELDICLEIKQFGVIRSMNIQTATAVVVHSYTVQHM